MAPKEQRPESIGSLLAKAKSGFSELLRGDSWDGDGLTRGFAELETLGGKATKDGLLTPQEHFDEMHRLSGHAVEASTAQRDTATANFFMAKTQTYESFRDMLTPPTETLPPQQTDTAQKEMTTPKHQVVD